MFRKPMRLEKWIAFDAAVGVDVLLGLADDSGDPDEGDGASENGYDGDDGTNASGHYGSESTPGAFSSHDLAPAHPGIMPLAALPDPGDLYYVSNHVSGSTVYEFTPISYEINYNASVKLVIPADFNTLDFIMPLYKRLHSVVTFTKDLLNDDHHAGLFFFDIWCDSADGKFSLLPSTTTASQLRDAGFVDNSFVVLQDGDHGSLLHYWTGGGTQGLGMMERDVVMIQSVDLPDGTSHLRFSIVTDMNRRNGVISGVFNSVVFEPAHRNLSGANYNYGFYFTPIPSANIGNPADYQPGGAYDTPMARHEVAGIITDLRTSYEPTPPIPPPSLPSAGTEC